MFILSLLFAGARALSILTKTNPASRYNLLNIPSETNIHVNFQGYDTSGRPMMKTFTKFEETLVDSDNSIHVINPDCSFDVIAPKDLLMHCRGRLMRIRNRSVQLLDQFSDAFTYDHVQRLTYVYRQRNIFVLQPNRTLPSCCVDDLRDFNVADGVLTILHTNGTITHNGTVLARVDPALYSRLPIFATKDFRMKTPPCEENSINYVAVVVIVTILVAIIESCGRLLLLAKTKLTG
ncbi:hypothetical protein GCK72_003792 [Caenorhabditis remanei]|uniref:Uncharacterized protein n=1 Tax=Caenorhabditis remanei TaxID=31234 RepID=A0A6A5HAH0_CAERE|nr:hypothetical protein GCK72_003792 [Caenorhabditis remanei]KAF1763846.1 hypothetical protein GCK72_003792 [Caenorhabditis remanei]